MKSRTSFFNPTLLRKNIARFAPVWGVYLLCLLAGLGLMYMDADHGMMNFWFASYMAQCIQVMAVVNLFYAPIVAALLFGDLFNSRMCNAIHAMPVRRETLFVTNAVSGLLFSLVPTAVMTALSLPLLAGTVVYNAPVIGILWFLATNLQFVCFFGMAVFCIFCTGNRLGFAALYAVLNGGAYIIYGIVDMLYTPMLYGVVTPTRLMQYLTPVFLMAEDPAVEVESYHDLLRLFEGRESEAIGNFHVNECYYNLIVLALVGLAFMVLGLLMYRKRHLECAGDAVAVRWLAPVFQTVAAVVGGAAAMVCLELFFGTRFGEAVTYGMVVVGLVVGWFAGKMLLERSTRVFRPKNWIGLGAITALFAVSLAMTHFDVFGIETRLPRVENVVSVTLNCNGAYEMTEKQDIDRMIRLQQLALEDRLENAGSYPQSYVDSFDTNRIPYPEGGFTYGDEPGQYSPDDPVYYADWITLEYHMKNGRKITPQYTVWASFEEGEIIREYASRWEHVLNHNRAVYGDEELPDFSRIHDMTIDSKRVPAELMNEETVLSFLDAVKADCEERKMTQDSYYHEGRFKVPVENPVDGVEFYYDRSVYVDITTLHGDSNQDYRGFYLQVYPDCTNTIRWLQQHDLLPYEMVDGNFGG